MALQFNNRGFTLLELSMVLVIVGLLTGGVLAGRSLLRSSELQSVYSDVQKYINATKEFKEKYAALPGDMPDAESIWGSDVGCPVVASNTIPKKETCNGTGDGIIFDAHIAGGPADYYESLRYWQELANAGMIEGSFTGAQGPVNAWDVTSGVNVPASKIKGGVYTIVYYGYQDGSGPSLFAANYGNSFVLMDHAAPPADVAVILTTEESLGLDRKFDDGRPGFGRILTMFNTGGGSDPIDCTTTNVASTAEYKLTVSGRKCMPVFITGF